MASLNTDHGFNLEPENSQESSVNTCSQASGETFPRDNELKTEYQQSTSSMSMTECSSSSSGDNAQAVNQMRFKENVQVNITPVESESGNSATAPSQSTFKTQARDFPAESREHGDIENKQEEAESAFALQASNSFAPSGDHARGAEISSHQENGHRLREEPQEESCALPSQVECSSREDAVSDLQAELQEAVGRDRRERERQRIREQQAEPPVCMQEGGAMAVNLRGVRQLRENLRILHRFYNFCLSCRWERLEVTVMLCGCQILCRWCFLDKGFLWYPGFVCPLCRHPSQGYKFSPDMLAFMLDRSRE